MSTNLIKLSQESEGQLNNLNQIIQKEKVGGWRSLITNLCKNLIEIIRKSFTSKDESQFKQMCENLLNAALNAIRESNEQSPANLVNYFKKFRNLKSSDLQLEYEYAEKLIEKAGGFQEAKAVVTWAFTSDVVEYADSARRPWHFFELFNQYGIYLKYNDKREIRRQELLKEYYKDKR